MVAKRVPTNRANVHTPIVKKSTQPSKIPSFHSRKRRNFFSAPPSLSLSLNLSEDQSKQQTPSVLEVYRGVQERIDETCEDITVVPNFSNVMYLEDCTGVVTSDQPVQTTKLSFQWKTPTCGCVILSITLNIFTDPGKDFHIEFHWFNYQEKMYYD